MVREKIRGNLNRPGVYLWGVKFSSYNFLGRNGKGAEKEEKKERTGGGEKRISSQSFP